jgi:Ca2+-binding EF-hand superfamily protein
MDKSGTIEINELYFMFLAHGINISKDEMRALFSLIDCNGNRGMTLDKFK